MLAERKKRIKELMIDLNSIPHCHSISRKLIEVLTLLIPEVVKECEKDNCKLPEIPKIPLAWISIKQFIDEHKFISSNAVTAHCNLSNKSCIKVDNKWYLNAGEFLKTFSKIPIYRNRMVNYGEKYAHLLDV